MEAASIRQFKVELSKRSLGYNLPQRVGRRLWLPMLLMALMAFPVGVILGIVRADEISAGGSASTIAALQHSSAAFIFLGFASVFAAVSFAIARILGQLRKGGGDLQEAAGRRVETLKMPVTAKVFLATMMMAMMALLATVVLHLVFTAGVSSTAASLDLAEQRFIVLEGVRRVGVATFLVAIAFGLASIIQVLRFQAYRVRELPNEEPVGRG